MATKTSRQLQVLAENGRKQGAQALVSQKRVAEHSPEKAPSRKRAILGDITNPNHKAVVTAAAAAAKKGGLIKPGPKKTVLRSRNIAVAAAAATHKPLAKAATATTVAAKPLPEKPTSSEEPQTSALPTASEKRRCSELPEGVADFDFESQNEPFSESTYAADIFKYYKEREASFVVSKYLDRQDELSVSMRAVLVDWMVEVQENFELNHETLYLAVKCVDRYLSLEPCSKTQLQLLGATAMFVSCKFDERCPPSVRDFLYICDDAYSHDELIAMEAHLLRVLDFQLGMPVSYRFLRRYARCARLPLEMLTLARYVLETSLMDYNVVDQRESKMAAAALLQALLMKGCSWNATLQHYSGYKAEELTNLHQHLNLFLYQQRNSNLEAIRSKYSHRVFSEVALTPLLPVETETS
ncbi:G2/mitotic-specific cyclin-B3 [Dermacentor andersoni]|uniref:G2/mitotic-specific cyclin-B3 n=1 Tax=Dermacentor andersoni TaxID=34620 RepID=UPI002155B661|nr:G2/mitotic-specific cyclin-B3-like [Dermacentor andersoni]XP_050043797.1 G2/mitotic-specific cyclin-B3-like [Dermacentor andersoni]